MARSDAAVAYDRYWELRSAKRTRERSKARAALAITLLEAEAQERGSKRPRLLEVGCGPGWALEVFAALGFDARGVDVSPRAVEATRARGLDADVLDIEKEDLPASHDVVVALEVLEHLFDPLRAIRRLRRAVAPGGRLVVSLPNEFHVLRRVSIALGCSSLGGHGHPHVRIFDLRRARELFREAGLRVLGWRPDSLVPPRFGKTRRVTGALVRALPGLLSLSNVFLLAGAEDAGESG